jgi:hypothetical protein
MTEKRFVKQELKVTEEMIRTEQRALWMRNHFPWLVKIINMFIKD